MANLTQVLKTIAFSSIFGVIASCNSGFDYDPYTSTLSFVPGEIIQFGDLRPNDNADQIFAQAKAYDAEGKTSKAFERYQQVTKSYPLSTKAPDSYFRMAQVYEAKDKRDKAFRTYQTLISEYVETPLYQPSLDRQVDIAHKSATGIHKNKFLGIRSKISPSTVDTMLDQILKNAPFAKSAPETAYLKGLIWQNNKDDERTLSNYRAVARTYPESSFAGEALFQIGSILHQQSLKGNTNLDNSKRALETFDELLTLYPNHPKAPDARQLKSAISGYDVNRSLEVAQFYEKKKQYTSAIFYYNEVIRSTSSSSDINKQAKARITALKNTPAN